ncbi:cell division protein ZapA [Thalassomonas sp. M1454]|uniref:cell division protein ZapA n=1 Tax=Thalassomonas sp. M1454 TaxID=2594477 RepID=UPI00117D49FD|nr:cell division protein ZapA [Thalassomonas sp. M1454]TRX57266.1 cell division protein ZapA [Thalassomonas sp. M1454]
MQTSVEIVLLDKRFSVNCDADQKDGLLQSALFLNKQLQQIQEKSVNGSLMNNVLKLALNLSYELTTSQKIQQRAEFNINLINANLEQAIDIQ